MGDDFMNDKLYDVLKHLAIIGLPALSAFYSKIAATWGLPYTEQIPETLSAFSLFLGTILCLSDVNYNRKQLNALNTTAKEASDVGE